MMGYFGDGFLPVLDRFGEEFLIIPNQSYFHILM
jgi:hypothetical protein